MSSVFFLSHQSSCTGLSKVSQRPCSRAGTATEFLYDRVHALHPRSTHCDMVSCSHKAWILLIDRWLTVALPGLAHNASRRLCCMDCRQSGSCSVLQEPSSAGWKVRSLKAASLFSAQGFLFVSLCLIIALRKLKPS